MNNRNNQEKNCIDIQTGFPDYLTDDLDNTAKKRIQNHISTCSNCRLELEELTATWTQLGILPEEQPGPNLRKNFYIMLESYQEGLDTVSLQSEKKEIGFLERVFKVKTIAEKLGKLWPAKPVYQFAMVLLFLVIGLGTGILIQQPHGPAMDTPQLAQLQSENNRIRRRLTLSLLNQSSPSQRIKGLYTSSHLEEPGDKILEALLYTLDNDPNVNVRVSAVDALYLFAHKPVVKKGLIKSLENQTSPMVQMALIELMEAMREKKAINGLKKLLENKELNPQVKQRAQQSIETLL
jgi:hypothetical protein